MKTYLMALLLGLTLTGCEFVSGPLELDQSIELTAKNGDTITLNKGYHQIKMEYKPRKDRLVLRVDDESGKSRKVLFNIPSGVNLPEYNGEFLLKPEESGQPIVLGGSIYTSVHNSDIRGGYESCTYEIRVYRCHQVQDPETGEYYKECGHYWVTRYGQRYREYYVKTTTTDVQGFLAQSEEGEKVGHFSGDKEFSQSITTFTGVCERDYHRSRHDRYDRRYH